MRTGILTTVAALLLGVGAGAAVAEPAPDASSPPPSAQPDPSASPTPEAEPTPCSGVECIPQPDEEPPTAPPPSPDEDGEELEEDDGPGGFAGWVADGVTSAINGFFRGLMTAALNPLLDLLGTTLLSTPTPQQLPRVGELWTNSWHITLAVYGILIMLGGVLVMAHESLQTQYSIKEIAPRIIIGFLAAGLSQFLATRAIELANALSQAVLGPGVDPDTAGTALRNMVLVSLQGGGSFVIMLGLALAVILVGILVTYVIRVSLTIIMIAGAPLALMCHALPQTEGIARWWWRTFGGLLAIQVAQSLTLVTALRVFLAEDDFVFSQFDNALVNVIVALALMYVLLRIPVWILNATRITHGRTLPGRIARGYLAYRTLGLLRGGAAGGRQAGGRAAGPGPRPPGPGGPGGAPRALHHPGPRRPGPQPLAGGGGHRPHRGGPGSPQRPPGQPQFLAPNTAGPPLPARRADGPPPPPRPRFSASPGAATPWPARGRPPGPAGFQAPSTAPPTPVRRTPQAPAQPRFQEPDRANPLPPPRRADRPTPPTTFLVGGSRLGPSVQRRDLPPLPPPPTRFRSPARPPQPGDEHERGDRP